eukprot:s4088_g9.t1
MWVTRALSLDNDEKKLHESLPAHAKKILVPKRILFFKSLLEEYQYADCDVWKELVSGTVLVGSVPAVDLFPAKFKPALKSIGELRKGAAASNAAIINSTRSSGDDFIDQEVLRKTLDELDSNWLRGPVDPGNPPDGAIVSRRFGILQSSGSQMKVRLIDDLSQSPINSTVQVECVPTLHTVDAVAALLLELNKRCPSQKWVGKTFDLSAAYRQLALASESLEHAYISVFDPNCRKPVIYHMLALPFGASKSVYSFLRVIHSVWWLGANCLHLCWTNFFDDFVTLARSSEAEVVNGCVKTFLWLLGWSLSGGEKDLEFSEVFRALGIEFSLSSWSSRKFALSNTKRRVAELVKTIEKVLDKGALLPHEALCLRGRMQFAKSQLWGRSSKASLDAVTRHAYGSERNLDKNTVTLLEFRANSPGGRAQSCTMHLARAVHDFHRCFIPATR